MARITKDVVMRQNAVADAGAELIIRKPHAADGSSIWKIVRDSGKLDLNSPYSYLMMGRYFYDTCAIAEMGGKPVGFVIGFRHPAKRDTLFVWQIAVDPKLRGRKVARRMIEHLLDRPGQSEIRYIEATISPSNEASQSLFLGFARDRKVTCKIMDGFKADLFPDGTHEDEMLFQIGPLK